MKRIKLEIYVWDYDASMWVLDNQYGSVLTEDCVKRLYKKWCNKWSNDTVFYVCGYTNSLKQSYGIVNDENLTIVSCKEYHNE